MHRWLLTAAALLIGLGFIMLRFSAPEALAQVGGQSETAVVQAEASLPQSISELDIQIEAWIAALAREQPFAEWRDARWTRVPLGPGLHGWLVLLHKQEREIGYIVVGSTEDGQLKLVEYGAGSNPLFSLHTLYRTMVQLDRIEPVQAASADDSIGLPLTAYSSPPRPLYYGPLHALWELDGDGEPQYIDAWTGEALPLTKQQLAAIQPFEPASALPARLPVLQSSVLLPGFDPFNHSHWLTDSPVAMTSETLRLLVTPNSPPVVFKANLYDRTLLVPAAVTGWQEWPGLPPYLRLELAGERYVPFDALLPYGSFHQRPKET